MSLMSEFRIGITTREVAFGQDCKALIPKRGIDPFFLTYAIRAQTSKILDLVDTAGHGTGRLQTDRIADLRIPIPQDPNDQRRYVALVKALDDKIAINERIVATEEELAITVASSKRWASMVPLGEVVRHVRDQVSPETFAVDRVAHYSLPAFDAGQMPELVSPTAIKSSKFLVDGPSVLLSKLNPSIPRVWSVDPSPEMPALASTEFLVLKPIDGISAHEIWAVSSQPDFINELAAKVTGTSNSHQRVKPADLLYTRIVDPRAISDSIRGLISSIADQARQARRESLALTELRDTLLPRLMSGEVRVREAEKFVEEVT
jgi:type I restriction enzyme S subunit